MVFHAEKLDPAWLKKAFQSTRQYLAAGMDERRRMEAQQEQLLGRIAAIDALFAQGVSTPRIKKQLGLTEGEATIRGWATRKRLPNWADPEWLARNQHRAFSLEAPLAELCAYYLTRMHHDRKNGNLEHTSNDRRLATRIALLLTPGAGKVVVPRATKRHYWGFKVRAQQLGEFLHGITDGKKRLPAKHLDTPEKREAFLKGILNAIGGISVTRVQSATGYFATLDHPSLLEDLAPLFTERGIFPTVRKMGKGQLMSMTGIELDALCASGLLSGQKQQAAMQALESRRLKRTGRRVQDFERVMDHLEKGTDRKVIAKETGVSDPSIRDWAKGMVPDQVRRYAQAFRIAQRLDLPFEVKHPRALEAGLRALGKK